MRLETSYQARLPELLEAALALPEGERPAFLRTIDDPTLRHEVVSLLSLDSEAESWFTSLAAAVDEAAASIALEAGDAADSAAAPYSASPSPPSDPLPGQCLGQYLLEERLGEGGMGVVYRAFDTRLERTVALKFPLAWLDFGIGAVERFVTEARAAAALDHPNVCTIHEVGTMESGAPFIAMAFYPGRTLEEVLRGGPLEPVRALEYTVQIARGLEAAHARGIVHRDVKPGNVMIADEGVVKLLDFGIAQRRSDGALAASLPVGTIDYMSPEQVSGASLDLRTDLWSLGVVLYEMCTGRRPLRRESEQATLHAILQERPVPACDLAPGLPAPLGRVIDRLLRKALEERYQSSTELLADLTEVAETLEGRQESNHTSRGRRSMARRAASALAGIAAVAVGVALIATGQPSPPSRVLVSDGVGDTASGDLLSQRLRQQLTGSRRVDLLDDEAIGDALQRMGRDPGVRLTPEIARELAVREGIEAYVHVTADRIGGSFTLGALLVEAETGNPLDFYGTTAFDTAGLEAAADSLARAIRTRFGDRLASVAAARPRLAVTTDSIRALEKYLQAVQSNRVGEFHRAIRLLEESQAIDSTFADAYLTEAFALEQIGLRAGRGQAAVLAAWELRNDLPAYERYTIEADYAWHVEGDLGKAVEALRLFHEEAARRVPGRVLNRRSYGLALLLNGQLDEAETVLQEGRRLAPCPVTKGILVSLLHTLGRDAEARSVLREAAMQWPTNPLLAADSAHFAAVAGHYREAHDLARNAHFGASRPFMLRSMAVFDAVEGRLREATDHLEQLRVVLLDSGLVAPAHEVTLGIGRLRLVAGDTASGIDGVDAFLTDHPLESMPPAERPYLSIALFYADAGRGARAEGLLASYEALVPAALKGPDRWMLHRLRAALHMASGRASLALDELRRAQDAPRIWGEWFSPLMFQMTDRPELARAYDLAGQPDSAIAIYERYLAARVLHRTELDAFQLADARRRLAVLYDHRRLPEQARAQRDALSVQWRHADPELIAKGPRRTSFTVSRRR